MYEYKLIGAFILSVLFVGIRCQSGEDEERFPGRPTLRPFDPPIDRPRILHHWPSRDHDYFPSSSCDTEIQTELAEVKLELQNMQQLVVGLRQKLDPDFKLPPPIESRCPPGFQYVSLARSCYKVVYEEHNWTSADQRCHGLHPGAHLVAITRNVENKALKAYLQHELAKNSHINVCKLHAWGDPQKMLWTSGQRQNETSCADPFVWKISDSTQLPLSFTYWSQHEPNCYGNKESCLHVRPSQTFKWNDVSCDHMFCPLCEYDPLQ